MAIKRMEEPEDEILSDGPEEKGNAA